MSTRRTISHVYHTAGGTKTRGITYFPTAASQRTFKLCLQHGSIAEFACSNGKVTLPRRKLSQCKSEDRYGIEGRFPNKLHRRP